MAYINTQTMQYPVSEQDIRNEYPNTSFPVPFSPPEGYAPVLNSPTPEVPNPVIQFAREVTPTQDELGNWMQQYEVVDKFQDYTDDKGVFHSKAEQEAAAIAADEAVKKAANKTQAEKLLSESDWTATMDVGNPQYRNPYLGNQNEFMTYRAQLCNIALNPPVTVVQWPTKPEENWITL